MRICICRKCKRFIEVNHIAETWSVPDSNGAVENCWDQHRYDPYQFTDDILE